MNTRQEREREKRESKSSQALGASNGKRERREGTARDIGEREKGENCNTQMISVKFGER